MKSVKFILMGFTSDPVQALLDRAFIEKHIDQPSFAGKGHDRDTKDDC